MKLLQYTAIAGLLASQAHLLAAKKCGNVIEGITNADGSVCCPTDCIVCGDAKCADRFSGSFSSCCIGDIKKANVKCGEPPCVLKAAVDTTSCGNGKGIWDPTKTACCPKKCKTCGGANCDIRNGEDHGYTGNDCCVGNIVRINKQCGDPPCVKTAKPLLRSHKPPCNDENGEVPCLRVYGERGVLGPAQTCCTKTQECIDNPISVPSKAGNIKNLCAEVKQCNTAAGETSCGEVFYPELPNNVCCKKGEKCIRGPMDVGTNCARNVKCDPGTTPCGHRPKLNPDDHDTLDTTCCSSTQKCFAVNNNCRGCSGSPYPYWFDGETACATPMTCPAGGEPCGAVRFRDAPETSKNTFCCKSPKKCKFPKKSTNGVYKSYCV